MAAGDRTGRLRFKRSPVRACAARAIFSCLQADRLDAEETPLTDTGAVKARGITALGAIDNGEA